MWYWSKDRQWNRTESRNKFLHFQSIDFDDSDKTIQGGKVFPTNGAEATRHPRYVSVSKTTTPRFSDSLEGLKGLNIFSCTLGPDLLQQKDTKSVKGKYMG